MLLTFLISTSVAIFAYPNIERHPNYHKLPFDVCGDSRWPTDRIVGGKEAGLGHFPWMVRLAYIKKQCADPLDYRCGGALVTRQHIVTAGHCVTHLPQDLCKVDGQLQQYELKSVRLGEYDSDTNPDCDEQGCADPVIDVGVEEVYAHPSFDKPKLQNDIGVIKMAFPVNFTEWIVPLCFIRGSYTDKKRLNEVGYVAGWGFVDFFAQTTDNHLMYINAPIVAMEKCNASYGRLVRLSKERQICAGGVKGQDSCLGDSGGPLAILEDDEHGPRFKLLGVVSFGRAMCAWRQAPAVHTNVPYYADWILDQL